MAIPGSFVAFAGVTIVVLGLSFFYVRQGTALRDLMARSTRAREELVGIEEVNRTLEFRIEQAFSLERISRVARENLGMVEPSVVRYVPLPASD